MERMKGIRRMGQASGSAIGSASLLLAGLALLSIGSKSSYGRGLDEGPRSQENAALQGTSTEKSYRTFYLLNSQPVEANDIQTDLRNMLPRSAIYYVPSQGALSVRGTGEDIEAAGKILSEIDRPKKMWRLTYTLTEMEADKVIGTQKYAMSVTSGKRTWLKEGIRVPLVTGKESSSHQNSGSQVQYVDVGISIEASLDGMKLQTKVEKSSLADEKASPPLDDPIIHQSTLEETVTLADGKPTLLGVLDLPESRHSLHVTIMSEPEK